eukprot:4113142-Amphidinium_carterae.1
MHKATEPLALMPLQRAFASHLLLDSQQPGPGGLLFGTCLELQLQQYGSMRYEAKACDSVTLIC